MKPTTCGFIGLGLIGGSLAKALREKIPDIFLIAYDMDKESLNLAYEEGTINQFSTDIGDDFKDCDYIFLCAPVARNDENLLTLAKHLGPDTILTDVGSTKTGILEQITAMNLCDRFIGGHPMAGSERFGYRNSKVTLLENAYYILTPSPGVPEEKVEGLKNLVSKIGAIPLVMTAGQHDHVTAAISHLPHVIAASLVNLVKNADSEEGIMKMIAAGGFKDITRIASSSPDMWQQICLTNGENISHLLEAYIQYLTDFLQIMQAKDAGKLHDFFDTARTYRESFIDAPSGPIKTEYVITVDIADKPGAIAAIASLLAMHDVSIKNIGINHNRELAEGALRIEFDEKETTDNAINILTTHGYQIHQKKA